MYNGQNKTPYKLPADRTKTTIKSNTSPGGGGSNELRFEDKKNHEEVYIHAQKDQNNVVENNETTEVGVDRKEDIGNDEKIDIGNDRTEKVGNNETISIGNDRTETVGSNEAISIGENRSKSVGGEELVSIGDNQVESIGNDQVVTVGASQITRAGQSITMTCGSSSLELHANGTIIMKGLSLQLVGAEHVDIVGELVDIN